MIFPDTIYEVFEWRAAQKPGAIWLRFESDTWSFADAAAEVDRYAVGLSEHGVVKGDRVAINCSSAGVNANSPETIFAWLAANKLGAIAAPLNPAYKPAELEGVLALITPRVVITAENVSDLKKRGLGSRTEKVSPDDTAVLLATSGTTGAPKAVMQTHRTYALTAEAFPWWLGLGESDTLMCPLPLFHINAQAYSTMGSLGCGGALALVPKFSASRFWDTVRAHHATEVNAVGAMIHILLSTEPHARDRDHSLKLVYSALALPEAKHRAFEDRFGVKMLVGYGLSETTFGTVWPLGRNDDPDHQKPYGAMGHLRQHPRFPTMNRGRVMRDDGVTEAEDGETGELYLSNPAMMAGYLGDEAQTRAVYDGTWFKTGDLVTRRQDVFTFVSRKKEVLRRRGENVAAAEIENALTSHPAIHEAAVKGFPSALGEDEIVGFVTLKEEPKAASETAPTAPTADELRAHVATLLADYKVPSRIHIMPPGKDGLPRTATERIAKHLLQEPPPKKE